MVTHINFAVDDDLADRAKEIKNNRDLTWPEFLDAATDTLEAGED